MIPRSKLRFLTLPAAVLVAGAWWSAALGGKPSAPAAPDGNPKVFNRDSRDDWGSAAGWTGQWTIDPWKDAAIHLVFRVTDERGESWRSVRATPGLIEGLTIEQLAGPSRTASFRLKRDAGTFACEGRVGRGRGAGLFELELDPAFADALARRGLARPTPEQQAELALGNVSLELIDELRRRGARFDVELLVRMSQHGVGSDYVFGLKELGYAPETVEDLIEARDHGVDPMFIRGMKEMDITDLSLPDLIHLRNQGVDPDYVRGMRELGHTSLTLDQLVQARNHGVDPSYIREMAEAGHEGLSLETYVRARDHGVTADFIRGLAAAGYEDATLEQLIEARDHGVDGKFARRAKSRLGKTPELARLIRLRDQGEID